MDKLLPNRLSRADRPSPPFNARCVPVGGPYWQRPAPVWALPAHHRRRLLCLFRLAFIQSVLRTSRPPDDPPSHPAKETEAADHADKVDSAVHHRESDREAFVRWVGEHMLAGARQQMTEDDDADAV